jgi:acetyl-CoA carboxylase carboxyl transferase subunit alpha
MSPAGIAGRSAAAAAALKLTSRDLKQLGLIDSIIPEPLGGAHRDPHQAAHTLDQYLTKSLRELKRFKIENLLERRYEKFRHMGEYTEKATRASSKAG